jgi:hypothetical protein
MRMLAKHRRVSGTTVQEWIELGTAELFECVAGREASTQEGESVAFRKRPHMRRANLMLCGLPAKKYKETIV